MKGRRDRKAGRLGRRIAFAVMRGNVETLREAARECSDDELAENINQIQEAKHPLTGQPIVTPTLMKMLDVLMEERDRRDKA